VIEVLDEGEPTIEGKPTISLHVLTSVQPQSGRMMQLSVIINRVRIFALLDSGSTHNFVNCDAAAQAGLELCGRAGLRVAVANGDHIRSPGSCHGLRIDVGGEPFNIDYYGLALGTFDTTLGVQWLESLGPIL
jgi:hypothetical protein